MPDEPKVVDRYGASYGHFTSDVYSEIRRQAFGKDIGQNSWLTLDELERFISFLNLTTSSRVLDVGCGSGGPALQVSRTTGCEVVGVDVREGCPRHREPDGRRGALRLARDLQARRRG